MNSNTVGAGAGQKGGAEWLDFYALLGVSPQADGPTVRKRIGEAYSEATANVDHRDLNRRHYFQTMVEQVLPQCRRVLLDPTMRARYDEENARHQAQEPGALDYVSFMASLQGASADSARQAVARPTEFDQLPERVREEITLARAVIEAVQSGSEFDLLPARTLSPAPLSTSSDSAVPFVQEADSSGPSRAPEARSRPVRPTPRPRPQPQSDEYLMGPSNGDLSGLSETMPVDGAARATPRPTEPTPSDHIASGGTTLDPEAQRIVTERLTKLQAEARQKRRPEPEATPEPGPGVSTREDRPAVTALPNDTEAHIRAKVIDLEAQGKTLGQLREEAQARAVSGQLEVGGHRKDPEKKVYRPRVSVETEEPAASKRRALLSPIITHIATGLIGASLLGIILSGKSSPPPAPLAPLNVIYSSELRPVLESLGERFKSSPEGAGSEVALAPSDSRDAMNTILASGADTADVWIPSEAVWSNRFNEVAARSGKPTVRAGSGLALSPLVLVARADQSRALAAQFPKRLIPSWSALRDAVAKNCVQHFGMTDPEKSGAGALVRTAMAREWCAASKVPFEAASMGDARLWSWMKGFENNVPQYKMAGDMVKDLALGTSAQYWWALAYESDAIYWIGQGKPIEVFYLPTTFYADHPFCRTERAGATPEASAATARFEKFLRSAPAQQAFLQGGFRAPEIDLSSKAAGNPFQSQTYAARGVRASGFPVGGRLDYRTVNSLVAAWKTRFR